MRIHNQNIKSIFELLGDDENSLSYGLGYTLYNCDSLLKSLVKKVYGKNLRFKHSDVILQKFGESDKGYTDFEVSFDSKYLFLIEAKKGWHLPETDQLKRYINRFKGYKKRRRLLIVLSECSDKYAYANLPKSLYNVKIQPLSWQEVIKSINTVYHHVGNKEKFILDELRKYLSQVIKMDNLESNWVYVVSLANSMPILQGITPKDLTRERRKYFYPSDGGWPKTPPNYIAFRFGGKLQFIQHVEKYEIIDDMHTEIPEVKKGRAKDYYLLYLGEPFEPRKVLPNGKIWSNGRLWCMLDTLFTSKSVKEASEISKKENILIKC